MVAVITSGSNKCINDSDSQILSLSRYNTNTGFIYTVEYVLSAHGRVT